MRRHIMNAYPLRHVGVLSLCLMAPLQVHAAANCAILNGPLLSMPCLGVGGSYLSSSWDLYQASPLRFRLNMAGPTASTANCADFNSQTFVAHLPCVSVNDTEFWADLKLVNTNPIEVEFSGFGQGSGPGTYFATGADDRFSATQQSSIAANMKTLDATVKQALVAVNELLYTDASVSSYADFDRRRSAATAALNMMETQATSVQTSSARSEPRSAPLSAELPETSIERADVAAGTLSLGISARADDIQAKLNNAAQITKTEAQRLRQQLQQEVNSVQAEGYANAGSVYNTLHTAALVIGNGAKIAGMVGSWFVCGPAMTSGSIASQLTATAGFYLGNTSTAIGIANDIAVFTGNHAVTQSIENSGLSIFGRANTVLGIITAKADTLAETANNVINVVDGVLGEYGYANINLTGGSANASAVSCNTPRNRDSAFCPTTQPEVSPQLRAGTYRDPNTGSSIVSTGLDTQWETAIRNLPGQVLFDPAPSVAYYFNSADLVFTGFSPQYRNTVTGIVYSDNSATCSYGTLLGSMSGNAFTGSYDSANSSGSTSTTIHQAGNATINGSTLSVTFDVNLNVSTTRASGTTDTHCNYHVASFPLTFLDATHGFRDAQSGDIRGQAACDLVTNFSYDLSSYARIANMEYIGMDCSNASLSVILRVE